ncbi:MAG: hypothetical protein ACXACY_31230 [Candidatus Hodarchaeales archaeon]|jgi:hypothetical protein
MDIDEHKAIVAEFKQRLEAKTAELATCQYRLNLGHRGLIKELQNLESSRGTGWQRSRMRQRLSLM